MNLALHPLVLSLSTLFTHLLERILALHAEFSPKERVIACGAEDRCRIVKFTNSEYVLRSPHCVCVHDAFISSLFITPEPTATLLTAARGKIVCGRRNETLIGERVPNRLFRR